MNISMTQKFHCLIDHAIDQLGSGNRREDRIEQNHQKTEHHRAQVVQLRNNKNDFAFESKISRYKHEARYPYNSKTIFGMK